MAVAVSIVFYLHRIQPGSATVIHEFTVADSSVVGGDKWKVTALPHDWHRERLEISTLRYRFYFSVSQLVEEPYALYIPVISQNVVAVLNGSTIGNGGSTVEPITRNWPGPLIFPIASESLTVGQNELVLDVYSEPIGRGLLPVFYFGKWTDLVAAYSHRKNLKQTALGTFMVILIAVAIFLFLITWHRPDSSEYAWGGATFLGLSGRLLPVFFPQIPVSAFIWDWWQHVCMGFTVLFILFFVNRYFKLRMRAIEVSASVFVLLLAAASFMFRGTPELQTQYFIYGAGVWGLCSLAIGIVPLTVAITNAINKKNKPALYIFCVGSVMFTLGFHDMLMVNAFLTRENGYLVHYASPLVALLLTTILISRLIETSNSLEELNNSLEQRIESSNSALTASYKKVQKMEREKILMQERERFNRDMHDGLGGHLSTALALAETNMGPDTSLTKTIRAATDEMRLMLDTTEAVGGDPGMIIGSLRPKLQVQTDSAGFQLLWKIEQTSKVDTLGHGTALNLMRIVQEVVSNAIKHSGGDTIQVSLRESEGHIVLEIADNGVCSNLSRSDGNGIGNLEKRAIELGATLTFNRVSDLGGLSVSVAFPSGSVFGSSKSMS